MSQDHDSAFSDQDLSEDEYRQFSIAALLCFLLALIATVIAVVNKYWIPLPIVVAVLSVITLGYMHASQRQFLGYRLAALAMFISIFAAVAAITYQQYRMYHLSNQAVAFGEKWLQLAQEGKMHELYQLSLKYDFRKQPGADLIKIFGTQKSPNPEMALYLEQEPEVSIRADGDQARFQLVGWKHSKTLLARESFDLGYLYFRPDGEIRKFNLRLTRYDYQTPPGPQWVAEGVANLDPAFTRAQTYAQQGTEPPPDDLN